MINNPRLGLIVHQATLLNNQVTTQPWVIVKMTAKGFWLSREAGINYWEIGSDKQKLSKNYFTKWLSNATKKVSEDREQAVSALLVDLMRYMEKCEQRYDASIDSVGIVEGFLGVPARERVSWNKTPR